MVVMNRASIHLHNANPRFGIAMMVGVLYFVIYRILLIGVQLIQKHYEIPGMKEAAV